MTERRRHRQDCHPFVLVPNVVLRSATPPSPALVFPPLLVLQTMALSPSSNSPAASPPPPLKRTTTLPPFLLPVSPLPVTPSALVPAPSRTAKTRAVPRRSSPFLRPSPSLLAAGCLADRWRSSGGRLRERTREPMAVRTLEGDREGRRRTSVWGSGEGRRKTTTKG